MSERVPGEARTAACRRGSAVIAVLTLLALHAAPAPARTLPPVVETSTPLSSANVSLVATLPLTGVTGGRFVGKYFFTTASGTFPLLPGPTSGLYIFDASKPEVPVPVGVLPLPHAENEDVEVSASRQLVLISQDDTQGLVGGILYIVSWADPEVPTLLKALPLPATAPRPNGGSGGGPGHIANCIEDCKQYAYVTGAGNGSIFIVDLSNPAEAKILPATAAIPASTNKAGLPNNAFRNGTVHDVNTDSTGAVWVTGSGGTAQLNATNPLSPSAVRWISPADNAARNQFIHHNSLKLDASTLLVTEEDWLQPQCGIQGATGQQGGFQTWRIETATGSGGLRFLDQWITELMNYTTDSAPAELLCSSHWFTFNDQKVVAVGWYNQGVRFLNVSNPSDIKQVGYFIAPGTMASAAYFVPGRSDLVWVTDYTRGIDIVKIAGGGVAAPTVVAPIRAEWLRPAAAPVAYRPSPVWGFACALPSVGPGVQSGAFRATGQELPGVAANESGP